MTKLSVYNLEGKETEKVELEDQSFSVEFNPALVHQVMVSLQNNQRTPAAHTKTKGEVRGGGKKPWKQKGTGRARAGSIRSPLWRGGGVTFGPRNNRNFHTKINKRVGKLVFKMVLNAKIKDEELKLLDNFNLTQPKTKELTKILDSLGISGQSVLLLTEKKQENLQRAASNIPQLAIKNAISVNTLDLLNFHFVIMEKSALEGLVKRMAAEKHVKPVSK